jgi:chromosome segregation ATPase
MTTGLSLALATVGLLLIGAFIIGISMLFRFRDGAKSSSAAGLPQLRTRANVLLVALDEALAAADNELGFAIAQFGDTATADYAAAVEKARGMATAAFRLRRELDDAYIEPVTKQREMALQIIAYSEAAQTQLEQHDRSFSTLRAAELEAPASLSALGTRITATAARVAPARKTLARLASDYRPAIVDEHQQAIAAAVTRLDAAKKTVAAAQKSLSPAGVNAVVADVRQAEQHVAGAAALLDSIDAVAAQLDDAAATVTSLVAAQKADLAEARRERDAAPDPDTGAAIVDAIDGLEKVLADVAKATKPADPIDRLDKLNAAIAELDTALATARNQTERLAHARSALAGTLVSARSQLTAARGFIAAGGGQVGADARTRLREAERELAVAEAEADPVEALDAARRAVTHARDADALARYDAQH